MSQLGAHVLAFDFCIEVLKRTSKNLAAGKAPTTFIVSPAFVRGEVGLVQADATTLNLASRTFDRCLSATPLDNRNERLRLFRVIAEALTNGSRYVCGVEYDDLYRRLFGLPVMRRYSPGGVLIEHLTMADLKRESGTYFRGLRMQLIRVHLPLVHKLPLWLSAPLTKLAGSIPIVRQFWSDRHGNCDPPDTNYSRSREKARLPRSQETLSLVQAKTRARTILGLGRARVGFCSAIPIWPRPLPCSDRRPS
jgi:SAM-dependent methyltransferase